MSASFEIDGVVLDTVMDAAGSVIGVRVRTADAELLDLHVSAGPGSFLPDDHIRLTGILAKDDDPPPEPDPDRPSPTPGGPNDPNPPPKPAVPVADFYAAVLRSLIGLGVSFTQQREGFDIAFREVSK